VFFTNKRKRDETHSRDPLIKRNADTKEGYTQNLSSLHFNED
jgi:hypothetical protein